MKDKISLIELFTTFAKVGLFTFGGGPAMLPMLVHEISKKKHWATEEELSDYFAIGQCTPGIIAVNTATFIGAKKRGVLGGIAATLGIVFPSLVIITILAGIISVFSENPYVKKAFLGIRIGVCVLIINTVAKLLKTAIKGKLTLFVFVIALILSVCIKTPPVWVVCFAVLFGSLCYKVGTPKDIFNG